MEWISFKNSTIRPNDGDPVLVQIKTSLSLKPEFEAVTYNANQRNGFTNSRGQAPRGQLIAWTKIEPYTGD